MNIKCVGDNYKLLVTVFAIVVTKIHYRYISVGHQHSEVVTNIEIQSQTSLSP